jgi:hypothetical protein
MFLGAVLGFLSIVPVFAIWHHSQSPLERFYSPQYVGSTLAQTPIGTVISFFHSRRNTRTYFVLLQGGRPVTSAAGLDPARHVSVRFVETTPRIFGAWLQTQIYGGREFRTVLQIPIALSIGIYFGLFLFGLSYDCVRRKRAREGVPLRGPDLMTRQAFNRATKGDGFQLHVFD